MQQKIKTALLSSIAAAALFITGCGSSSSSSDYNQEATKVVDDISYQNMYPYVQALDPNATLSFGYKAVRLVYNTTDPEGNTVQASGVLVIPEAPDAVKQKFGGVYPISVVVDNHGTIFKNSDAPSNVEIPDGIPNLKTAILFTGELGFATVIPDYLGYGVSQGHVHPYIMKFSAQASIDMLNAAEKYLKDNNYTVTNDVYISGYSEGGYVAMAMAQELQDENTSYDIKAVAPMAGPYDIEKLGLYDLNDSNKMVFPAFLAEIAYSYSKIYNLNINDIVDKPEVFNNYDLFDGDYSEIGIHYLLGLTNFSKNDFGFYSHYPDELFKKSYIDDFETNASNPLRLKLHENDIYAWKPEMPVHIVNCIDDEIIPYQIAQEANATMNALGAPNVTLTGIPSSLLPPATEDEPFVHQRCAPLAYKDAAEFFYKIRGY